MSEIKVGDWVVVKPGVGFLDKSLYNRMFRVKTLTQQWDAYSMIDMIGFMMNGNLVHFSRTLFVKAPNAFYLDALEDDC